MSVDIKALMEGKPQHWTQEGLCRGDERFTGRYEALSVVDKFDMSAICLSCPVLNECNDWANREQVIEVFAAGYWRHPHG